MAVKILAIAGSPRRGGNSEILLDAFLQGAISAGATAEKAVADDLRVTPCTECQECFETGECVTKDEMQQLYRALLESDGVVIATPTFFMGPPAQLKAVIDRCQALWARKKILKQPLRPDNRRAKGFLMAVGAWPRGDVAFQGAKNAVKALFATIDADYAGELLFPGVDTKGAIKKREGALVQATEAGKRFAQSL